MVAPEVIQIKLLFIIWQGNSERSDWFLIGWDFTIRTVSTEMAQAVYFCYFQKPANLFAA